MSTNRPPAQRPARRTIVGPRVRRSLAPNVFEAFREVVFGYPAGVDHLAARMGVRAGTLYNKADAGDDSHNQPTLRDVVLVTQLTGDVQVLDALDGMFGRAAFDVYEMGGSSDEDLLILLSRMGKELGEFHGAFADGLSQRRFDAVTVRRMRAQAFDAISALMTLVHRVEDLVDDGEEDFTDLAGRP